MTQLDKLKSLGVLTLEVKNNEAKAVNPYSSKMIPNNFTPPYRGILKKWHDANNLPPLPTSGIPDGTVKIEEVKEEEQVRGDKGWHNMGEDFYNNVKNIEDRRIALVYKQVKEEEAKADSEHDISQAEPDTEKCSSCGGRTSLVTGTLYYEPDSEPYLNGIQESALTNSGEIWVGAFKCDDCDEVQGFWTE